MAYSSWSLGLLFIGWIIKLRMEYWGRIIIIIFRGEYFFERRGEGGNVTFRIIKD